MYGKDERFPWLLLSEFLAVEFVFFLIPYSVFHLQKIIPSGCFF